MSLRPATNDGDNNIQRAEFINCEGCLFELWRVLSLPGFERDNGQIPGCFFYLYEHGYLQTYHNQTVSHSVSSGLGALETKPLRVEMKYLIRNRTSNQWLYHKSQHSTDRVGDQMIVCTQIK